MAEGQLKSLDDRIEHALLSKRRVFLSDQVDQNTAKDLIRKLWFLEWENPGKPILFMINSPGGSVDAGFAIWDTIQLLTSPVVTLVTGLAASMGSLLSLSASKGMRLATQYSRIMIHQPLIGGIIKGQATDLEIQAKEMLKTREIIVDIYCQSSGKDKKTIEKAIDRDNWMTAKEAAEEMNLIDHVIQSSKELDSFLQ
ncbi:MAG: ATP-dependent Clp protease proteolytic subunit [Chlamydiae bacterium CG10_big_fil_rev_8_21_14_0_10_35_9]|nr:MAG: ATP-dependent Clp protease proteolytic subunit [Chlamydiae bacterium CG10_big_fil_rev_8_21_14_0_10_35_9]